MRAVEAVRAVGAVIGLLGALITTAESQISGSRRLDDFESPSAWTAAPSDGVVLTTRSDSGHTGRGVRLDFDFQGHGGYAVLHKALPFDLPENYALTFWLKANAPVNNLEFKLIDSTGDNVWWRNQRNYQFQGGWRKITIRKRQIEFAWGPAGGGELKRVAALEFAITAGSGGKGTVWLDDLTLEQREPERPYDLTPAVTASRSLAGFPPQAAIDGDTITAWRASSSGERWLTLDFQKPREFGGLVVSWEPRRYSTQYAVELSDDNRRWTSIYQTQGGNGGRDYLYLPESEARYLRLRLLRSAGNGQGYGIRSIAVEPLEWSATLNQFFHQVAGAAPRGRYPRYLLDEQSYWTIVGVSGDGHRALLGADGSFEPYAGEFSIEPFLLDEGRLLSWADGKPRQSLEDRYLPIPSVTREHGQLVLRVTAAAIGEPHRSAALVRYRITNRGTATRGFTMALTLRPFQVNPSWQFLGVPGGAGRIDSITGDTAGARVNRHSIQVLTPASRFGAASYDGGEVTEFLSIGRLPLPKRVLDRFAHASGAWAWNLDLGPGQSREIYLLFPWEGDSLAVSGENAARVLASTIDGWRAQLSRVRLTLPESARPIGDALRSSLAYMMINRDGPALQPGARSYRRSWIRDGAMIGAALLRLGQPEPVREFLEWYAPYQYDTGKVPCCVDARGADPVPEHDSHGELIYAIADYYRATHDREFTQRMWPHVERAVAYIDSLRRSLRTDGYRKPDSLRYFGLMPPSISHEGYSAKPVHSYWDDFFTLRGLADAAYLAGQLGRSDRARYEESRDQFRSDLLASLRSTIAQAHIDYLPGSADLADYDPTSSTIALSPGGLLDSLPQDIVGATWDRYVREARARRDSTAWDAYTPYEWRNVGALVRLGRRDDANTVFRLLFAGRRPAEWNQWPEVVWRDSAAPQFLGDLPHTWVASDFARSLLDMIAYVREGDSTLVIGAGIPLEWVRDSVGIGVKDLPVGGAKISFAARADGPDVVATVEGSGPLPGGGILLVLPGDARGAVRLSSLPARVVYRP